ncbi:MAG: CarD family transcriptional regulator [Clostridia bacterium]
MEFRVGDRVVYPSHGSGTIEGIERREVLGEESEYLEVGLKASEMKVYIPVDEAEAVGLRRVVDDDTVRECLDLLSNDSTTMSTNWNRRFRANTEKVKTGDIFEVAEVVRNLTVRDEERGLATSERKMLDETREILCSEVALSLGIDLEEAIELIDEALGTHREDEEEPEGDGEQSEEELETKEA